MRIVAWIGWSWGASLVFWVVFGACVVEAPDAAEPPAARLITSWDPLACGEPHRVVVELEDDDGAGLAGSAPCAHGELALDLRRWGIYRGRVYSWVLDHPIRSVTPVSLTIDAPIVRWQVATPP